MKRDDKTEYLVFWYDIPRITEAEQTNKIT